jgi:hypothetical protein
VPAFLTACVIAAWLVAVQAAGTARQPAPPALQFETLDARPADEPRLRRLDGDQLRAIVQVVGLEDPGPPIRVVLAPEGSELARATSSWIAGFADGAAGTVVLFPSRSLRYPHDSLEAVLRHEVAHILIARAADGRVVPRWFDEGLAVVAERAWHFEDRWQLAWALVSANQLRMDEVNDLFQAGPRGADRAYALASAFVRHLIETQGSGVPARILDAVGSGVPFEMAFEQATGRSLVDAERGFHAELTSWTRRLPLLTSPFVLWMIVTLLALSAIYVRRRRSAERRRKWAEEDARDVGWPSSFRVFVASLFVSSWLVVDATAQGQSPRTLLDRAVAEFSKGRIAESVSAFDELARVVPAEAPYLWQRGIALYYAGRYRDCRAQFESHRTVNSDDVENAAWHFLCVARGESSQAARAALLPVGPDSRVPMREVYEMFKGSTTADAVLTAAGTRPQARFYAHLYIGLYFEATGDAARAREHIELAAQPQFADAGGYMHMVAVVHQTRLKGK